MLPKQLSAGGHNGPHEGGCVMEVASLLAKEPWTDRPSCTNAVVTAMAQAVNDELPDAERQKLWAFLPRIMRARRTDSDHRINVRLAIWCARQALEHIPEDHHRTREAAEEAIAAAEKWLADPNEEAATNATNAANAAYASGAASANAAYASGAAFAAAAYASGAAFAAAALASGAAFAAAALATNAPDLLALLDGLLDEWQIAMKAEDEDLYFPQEWEEEALAFVFERMAEVEA